MLPAWLIFEHPTKGRRPKVLYRNVIRPLLFRTSAGDPESVHEKALALLSWIGEHPRLSGIIARYATVLDPRLQQEVMGLPFHSPFGLAAGFDKNGIALTGLASLGFSHIEMGTITPLEQKGNSRPRMFRFPKDRALINRMGFNNDGAKLVLEWLKHGKQLKVPLGISLGKGKDTPLEKAPGDYQQVLTYLYGHGDYFVVNVSSPNTAGLRALQGKEHLDGLIDELQDTLKAYAHQAGRTKPKPLLVKIAPDLTWEAIDELVDVCLARKVSGLIATNTTLSRQGLSVETSEAGGMSGEPLRQRSLEVVSYLRKHLPTNYPIIGVGGIMTAEDAYAMLKAGATLLQGYTGFVYGGPFFAREINRGLLALMDRDEITHVSQIHSLAS